MTNKEDKAVEVSVMDYLTAHQRWNDFWAAQNQDKRYQPFYQYLGMHSTAARHITGMQYARPSAKKPSKVMIRGSAARKVAMLCGPNFYALLKAHAIKRFDK